MKIELGGMPDALPWLLEKTTLALVEAAHMVDLANEADTNTWYRNELKRRSAASIGRLAPVIAVLCGKKAYAPGVGQWEQIVENGTDGLRTWATRCSLSDNIDSFLPRRWAEERDETENSKKEERIEKPAFRSDAENRSSIRLALLSNCSRWLLKHKASVATQRLLLWLMQQTENGEYVDVVVLSRRLLPLDIGASPDETSLAYEELFKAGVIELADYLPQPPNEDCFLVRITALPENTSKHPQQFIPVSFGD